MTMPLANPELLPYLEPVDELVSALKTRAQTAEAQVASLQSQVAGDAGTLAGDDSHIAALTSQVTELGEQIASLTSLLPRRVMFDGPPSSIANMLKSPFDIAGGGPAWKAADWGKIPTGVAHLSIADKASDTTKTVLDIEAKYSQPTDAPAFLAARRLLGFTGTLYFWYGQIPAVEAALNGETCYVWIADATGTFHDYTPDGGARPPLPPNMILVATQFSGSPKNQALGYDISTVNDPLWLRSYS